MSTVGGINAQHQQELWKGAGFGGLLGTFIGRPILGALGGLAYKLFTTEGLADAATKLVGDLTGSQDPLGSLSQLFGAGPSSASASASGSTPASGSASPPTASAIPGWAKALGIGALAIGAVSFLQNNVLSTFMGIPYGGGQQFFGQPYYGGFGLGYPYM